MTTTYRSPRGTLARTVPVRAMTAALAAALLVASPGQTRAQDADAASAAANANNPLANMKTFNLHNYRFAKLYGVEETANTAWLRTAIPTGRVLWRASLPISSVPASGGDYTSGLGDLNVFAAYLLKSEPSLNLGIGPQVTMPTASDDALGTGKWQLGLTGVVFAVPSPVFQVGALIQWQTSVAGDDDRADASQFVFQPFTFWQLGGGWYLRNSAIWLFNLETDTYNVPIGLGAGKVIQMGNVVFNIFAEPQFTLLHDGVGQPATQIFIGFNTQLMGG